MQTKYYLGRKNLRTNYRLYKTENDTHYRVWVCRYGRFYSWNDCHTPPKDMKPIRPENAHEILFLNCL